MESIVNKSITSGVFTNSLKEVLIWPLIKKPNLDILNQNYWPVSNLTFLSKTIECTVSSCLVSYIDNNHLIEVNLSAYRANHSTEITLIKVKLDILKVTDQHGVVCLLLLNLSDAFDTRDHKNSTQKIRRMLWNHRIGSTVDQLPLNKQKTMSCLWSWNQWPWPLWYHREVILVLFTHYMVPVGDICWSNNMNL